jgi:hypothetical protein
MQKSVALSVCEAEQTAGVLCAQDMLYVRDIIELMGLKVKLPMIPEMDNKGANGAHKSRGSRRYSSHQVL